VTAAKGGGGGGGKEGGKESKDVREFARKDSINQ